jgi:uncharacterized protein YqeY
MSILTRIRSDALEARKARSGAAGVLVTLIGEIDTRAKTLNPPRDLTDDEVLALVRKFLKNIDETLGVLASGPESADRHSAAAKLRAERAALEIYLPQQMDEEAIRAFAAPHVGRGASLGDLMAALKAAHAGGYDGKLASTVFRSMLAA